ncbi:hypothetical protein J6590_077640 [Homalodisca vitripennis]|nr:hypothetical protein J6590_077640 [Homalodisca vitripennis]
MGLTQEIIIPCYLDRADLKWYENIEERLGAALTWEQLKAAMKDAFKTIAWEEQLGVQITNAYAGRGRRQRGREVPPVAAASAPASKKGHVLLQLQK